MLGTVHACVGAAIGSIVKSRGGAFVGGVLSHLVLDMVPHRDVAPALDVPVMAAVLAGVAGLRGVDSPEFWGAVGGVAPDAEHALLMAGLIDKDHEIFPTHVRDGAFHGRESDERWSQLLVAAVSVLTLALSARMPVDTAGNR